MRRAVTIAAVAIVSLYALYVVALNVFLSTSLFERVINQDPQTLLVTYERGWTLWPGTIHARKLSIRSSDSHVQFLLRVERCTFDLSFVDLARKKFHTTRVEGSGVTFDARQRIDAPAATPEHVDALPPIPGFERIPFKPAGPPDDRERWDDRQYHLWTVHLEDVLAADVRRIWIDTARFEGDARVTGGFFLKPIRSVSVGPVHVDIRSGRTTLLDRPITETIAGALDVRIETFDPRTVDGTSLLHHLSGSTDLHGRAPQLANLPRALTGDVRIAGSAELRRIAVRVEHGNVVKDSHVEVVLPGASVEAAGHRLAADLALVADVANEPGPARLTFRLDARGVTATSAGEGGEAILVDAPAIEVIADATSLDLAAPLGDLHVAADMAEGKIPDARLLGRYLPPDASLGIEGGRARARAHVEAWLGERRAKAESRVEADDLDLRVAKTRLRGATTVDLAVAAWRWDARRLEGARATVHVVSGSIATADRPERRVVDVHGLGITVDASVVDLDDPMRTFHASVEMPDAQIVDRGLLRRYLPKGEQMRVAKGHARFDARCVLDVDDHRGRGTLDLHATRMGFTLHELELLADVRAHARVHDWAWEHGDLALDEAKVDVTKLTVTAGGESAPALAIARISVGARSDRFAFSDPLGRLVLNGAMEGAVLDDPTALDAFLPEGAAVTFDADKKGARFDARLEVDVDRHVARGTVSARGHGIGVRGTAVRVRGDVDASAEVADWRVDEGRMRVKSARIAIQQAAARFGESRRRDGADGGGPPDLHAKRIELHAKTDDLDLAHPTLVGVDYRLVVDGARMDDATRLGALFSKADATAFAVESGRASGHADVTVTSSEGRATGSAEVVLENAGLRFNGAHMAGDFVLAANVKGFDRPRDAVDVSGSKITMRNVRTVRGASETSAWSGELDLLQGALRISEAPGFDAFAQLRADDAKPFLAMFLGDSLPKVVVGMLEADGLSGQARIVIEQERAAILGAHVRGDDVAAYGDFVVVGERVRGEAVVAKGPLSAGVKVDDSGTYVRLFGLEGWREEEKRASLALFAEGEAKAKAKTDAKTKAKADAKTDAKAKAKAKAKADGR